MPERALLIWNPVAGRRPKQRRRQIGQLAVALRRGGWQVDAAETVPVGGAIPAAADGIREGYTALVACGGDGTLNQITRALHTEPRPADLPKLAVVPFGTANVFANAVGCPRAPGAAARWLLRAQPRPVALGRALTDAGSQYFLAVASVGVDAEAVHRLRVEDKRRWGKLAYIAAAIAAWKRHIAAPIQYQIEGQQDVADGLILGLTRYYGGKLRLGTVAPGGSIALALRGAPRLLPWQALWLATVGLERAPGVQRLPHGAIHILTAGLPLELDGEPAGHTPATIEVIQGGIRMLIADRP